MSKVASVRRAWHDGGSAELVRRTRVWAAKAIYPGPLPTARAARAKAPARSAPPAAQPRATANEVEYDVALEWIEVHRASYERLTAAVAPYVDVNGVFFDVGGNIGYFTKRLAERTGFRGTAHLFEPVPNLVRLSARTLDGVPYTAAVHEFGLSDADAELELFMSTAGNLGWNTIVGQRATSAMESIRIQVKAFATCGVDDIPSFIKIDVEGAEHRVLSGMFDALASWPVKPVILCEIGWGVKHPEWAQELVAFERLADLGYRSVDVEGAPVDVSALQRTTDVLFLPAGTT